MKKENRQNQQQVSEPSDEVVATKAYQIWENEGRPDGHDFDHWIQAKSQLTGASEPAHAQEAGRSA